VATRYFTLEQARALLPRVRSSMGQALQLHRHLRTSVASLGDAGHEVDWALLRGEQQLDEQADERSTQALARARMIYMALRESIAQIEALGVEVKSVMNGLIDFPSWCDGEHEVVLCYKLGEPELEFFHDADEGFTGRRPITGHEFMSERDETLGPFAERELDAGRDAREIESAREGRELESAQEGRDLEFSHDLPEPQRQ
jgi:hypothetical protein